MILADDKKRRGQPTKKDDGNGSERGVETRIIGLGEYGWIE